MTKRQYLLGFSWLAGLSLLCALVLSYEYGLFMVKNSSLSAKVSSELGYELAQARVDFVMSGRNSMMGSGGIKFVTQNPGRPGRSFLIEEATTAPTYKLYRKGYSFTVKTQPGANPDPEKVIQSLRQVISKARGRH